MPNKTNLFFAIFPVIVFFGVLNTLHGTRKDSKTTIQPACFSAPLWVYNEEKRAYYRQDWCKTGKSPVYWENIPFPEKESKNEKFLCLR
ncbi:MAG: hypothetical protein IPL26_00045 [Leptospiraceae bacterium]|nr:hypothetical protein [Leptospiraceae bacterium]